MKKIITFLFFLTLFPLWGAGGYTLKVTVTGFDNNKGKAYIGLYDTKEKMLKGLVETIVNQQVTVNFNDLPEGKYAVKVYHDENGNGKLDTGMFGIPKEGWGVSNNVKVVMSAPKIEEMLFDLNGNKSINIELK
jgi:uncharacterized protein (DUF2141 family)